MQWLPPVFRSAAQHRVPHPGQQGVSQSNFLPRPQYHFILQSVKEPLLFFVRNSAISRHKRRGRWALLKKAYILFTKAAFKYTGIQGNSFRNKHNTPIHSVPHITSPPKPRQSKPSVTETFRGHSFLASKPVAPLHPPKKKKNSPFPHC